MKSMLDFFAACLLVIVAVAVALYVFVRQVPEGASGVRLLSGKRTDELLRPGWHFRVPYWYDMKAYSGMIYHGSMGVPMGASTSGACETSHQHAWVVQWYIADARPVYDQQQQHPDWSNGAVGERAIADALCKAHRARFTATSGPYPLLALNGDERAVMNAEVKHALQAAGLVIHEVTRLPESAAGARPESPR